jgi:hypothetical protein
VDSVHCPADTRRILWDKLAGEWKPRRLAELVTEVTLAGLEEKVRAILKGEIRGRVVVQLP